VTVDGEATLGCVSLLELIAPARRVAVVGLAKNTGKTETLGAILRELRQQGQTVGVTSVGRDGEARDVIDGRIEKPRVTLCAGSLVATTDALLRASAIPYELLEKTWMRTPLGRVLIARMNGEGAVEVAGPGAARDLREVADAMLAHGAELVLVDGAIDRRVASSPSVSEGVVLCTGAVLGEQIEEVVKWTRDAIELVRLPECESERTRALAAASRESLLLEGASEEPVVLHPRLTLTGTAQDVSELLDAHRDAYKLVVQGALCEPFLRELLLAARGRKLELIVQDSTKVFLSGHGYEWYRRQGLSLCVLAPIRLCAVTVNPVAPRSHSFPSGQLRRLLRAAIPDVALLDVRDEGRSPE
jgi:hypothetical protein